MAWPDSSSTRPPDTRPSALSSQSSAATSPVTADRSSTRTGVPPASSTSRGTGVPSRAATRSPSMSPGGGRSGGDPTLTWIVAYGWVKVTCCAQASSSVNPPTTRSSSRSSSEVSSSAWEPSNHSVSASIDRANPSTRSTSTPAGPSSPTRVHGGRSVIPTRIDPPSTRSSVPSGSRRTTPGPCFVERATPTTGSASWQTSTSPRIEGPARRSSSIGPVPAGRPDAPRSPRFAEMGPRVPDRHGPPQRGPLVGGRRRGGRGGLPPGTPADGRRASSGPDPSPVHGRPGIGRARPPSMDPRHRRARRAGGRPPNAPGAGRGGFQDAADRPSMAVQGDEGRRPGGCDLPVGRSGQARRGHGRPGPDRGDRGHSGPGDLSGGSHRDQSAGSQGAEPSSLVRRAGAAPPERPGLGLPLVPGQEIQPPPGAQLALLRPVERPG